MTDGKARLLRLSAGDRQARIVNARETPWREVHRRVWEEFCANPVAATMTAEQRTIIGGWTESFTKDMRPDLLFFAGLLSVLQGAMRPRRE